MERVGVLVRKHLKHEWMTEDEECELLAILERTGE